jgi:DNA polymerase I
MNHLIIDTSYLIYRSYFAYPHLTAREVPMGAVYGFAKSIISICHDLQPATLVFALDLPQPTWRDEVFDQYKAGRSPMDPQMRTQIPLVLEWVRLVSKNVIGVGGYEADDVIFTATQRILAEHPDDTVYIFSSDRDLYQLLDNHRTLFIKTHKGNTTFYGLNEFHAEFGVSAAQWVDYKALVGDSSDNLKGVAGIGPKTASTLLNHVGDLHQLFVALGIQNTELVPHVEPKNLSEILESEKIKKLITKITECKSDVLQTYHLAQLQTVHDMTIQADPGDFALSIEFFEQYEFRSLITQLKKQGFITAEPATQKSSPLADAQDALF